MEEGEVYELDLTPLGDSEDLEDDFFELIEIDMKNDEKGILGKIMEKLPPFSDKNELIYSTNTFRGESTENLYVVSRICKGDFLGILYYIDTDRFNEIWSDEVFSRNAKEVLEDDCHNFYAVEDYNVRDDSKPTKSQNS